MPSSDHEDLEVDVGDGHLDDEDKVLRWAVELD